MPSHLTLVLDAPLMSFGGEAIDNYGVVRDFPARSMIAGLVGNALGYDRADGERLDRLQARLVVGSARLREGMRIRDFQTAKLEAADKGWTTRGRVEGRAGGAATYKAPHIRYRDADADAIVLVVLRLQPQDEAPALADLEHALRYPQRPLFLGRKPFLPSRPLAAGTVEAPDIRSALDAARRSLCQDTDRSEPKPATRAQWPLGEGESDGQRELDICDERSWISGVHGGLRRVVEGLLPVTDASNSPASEGQS